MRLRTRPTSNENKLSHRSRNRSGSFIKTGFLSYRASFAFISSFIIHSLAFIQSGHWFAAAQPFRIANCLAIASAKRVYLRTGKTIPRRRLYSG
jgi:hypothetical protein